MVAERRVIEQVMARVRSELLGPSKIVHHVGEHSDLYKAGILDSLSLAQLIRTLEIDLGRAADTEKLFNSELKSPAQIAALFLA